MSVRRVVARRVAAGGVRHRFLALWELAVVVFD